MLPKMVIALKNRETRKTALITTTIALAILATALTFTTMMPGALAQPTMTSKSSWSVSLAMLEVQSNSPRHRKCLTRHFS